MVFLDTIEDLAWLTEVHGIPTAGMFGAMLFGNEDWPERVELYYADDYRACRAVYALQDDGNAPKRPHTIKGTR